jgi:hypothetical protein
LDAVKFSFLSGLNEKTKNYEKTAIHSGYYFWRRKNFINYAAPSVLIILIVSAGALVLAKKNMMPEGFSRQIRRLSENIQIQIAGEQQKPFLYDEFAKRRLEEFKKTENLKNTKLVDLNEDLHYEISSAALGASDPGLSEAETKNLCGSLAGLVEEYEQISGEEYENLNNLINVCETFSNASDYNNR